MVKIHFVGGENLVVELADTAGLREVLKQPDEVLEVTYDGKLVLVPVRAISAVAFLS